MKPYSKVPGNKSPQKLSPELIESVRDHSPIESVTAEYTKLRKSGAQFAGLCPLHEERTPSFYVNPAKGMFFCHGCGAHGDVFDFVKRVLGCEFWQAVHYLAARAGISKSGFTPTPELRQRVARVTARRFDEREFKDFCNRHVDAINAKHRALGRSATNAERCLGKGKLSADEEELAWAALERYFAFAARIEREELCELETLRREWLAQRGSEERDAA